MRNYYMNETEGVIYTEVEKHKAEAAGCIDEFRLIGKFRSRKEAWAFYRDNM